MRRLPITDGATGGCPDRCEHLPGEVRRRIDGTKRIQELSQLVECGRAGTRLDVAPKQAVHTPALVIRERVIEPAV
jgi:hypothetical protein